MIVMDAIFLALGLFLTNPKCQKTSLSGEITSFFGASIIQDEEAHACCKESTIRSVKMRGTGELADADDSKNSVKSEVETVAKETIRPWQPVSEQVPANHCCV